MAHGRYDLTEFEWKPVQPLLPDKPRGVRRGAPIFALHGKDDACGKNCFILACSHTSPSTRLAISIRCISDVPP